MKKIISAVLAAILCMSVSACGGNSSFDIDISSLSGELSGLPCFNNDIYKLEDSSLSYMYELADGVSASVYASSGATADEVAVFEAPDEDTAQQQLEIAKTHIDERTAAYASYMPDEVTKLNSAIVVREGRYVIVCVCSDYDAAQAVIDTYIA